ncbi:MAG: hypothetical protein IPL53_20900 [Ignavibacteria bacterium]|nr:hypothetical protein [Ignavibacteria bacterium]
MPCEDKNPLVREGTSTLNRVLAALSTDYAKVDERDEADIILFAKRYASYLNYFNSSNTPDGHWDALMKMDISVTLATLSKIDVRKISDYKKLLYKRIKSETNPNETKKQFKFIFDLIFSLAKIIDEQFRLFPDGPDYKITFKNIITDKMQQSVVNLNELFFQYTGILNLIDKSAPNLDSEAPVSVSSSGLFNISDLSEEWRTKLPNILITVPATTPKEQIIYIVNHNLFNEQIETLLQGLAAIVKNAGQLFTQTLEDFPKHTPHYSLFLTFVRLFRFPQDHLNTYTRRHLDFYYKDGLRLKNKTAEPDSAHLTFELQKPVNQHLLKKSILFKGGKDITGKEISYSLTNDVVLNKAAVVKIQSCQNVIKGGKNFLQASTAANSDDGQGAKITSADKSWYTFGDVNKAANAETGFAIASNILFLNEGHRTICVSINFDKDIPELNKSKFRLNCFNAKLTGKKDWLSKAPDKVKYDAENFQLSFTIILEADAPAIIPYTEKIHKEKLEISLPLLKIYLDQNSANSIPYTVLCDRKISSIDITVEVDDAKDLILSNDRGSIDASKPFKPFGDFPESDSGFYIGSKEIFQKNVKSITLNTNWKNGASPSNQFSVKYLKRMKWTDAFTLSGNQISLSSPNVSAKTAIDFAPNEILKSTTIDGFIRLKFNQSGLSMQDHLNNVSDTLKNTKLTVSGNTTSVDIPPVPVPSEIVLNRFSLSYVADETISFDKRADRSNNLFYHFTSFGHYEVHPDLFGAEVTEAETSEKLTLIPNVINSGELFIGFDGAEEDSVVTVLFQVAEGSSNPLKNMEKLKWYYLSQNNNWKTFPGQSVADNTNNFTQPGIVTLTLPKDISNANTAFEKGLHWIKAAVENNTDAVCKMILIQAQAGRVELVQDETNQIEFRQTLPPNTISKLSVGDALVKNISQPFDSFNGRTRESDEHFYVRVSERLRHKQRAITIWDYEHIILEKFQKIFKVKCLNHTGFYKKNETDTEEIYCENYPGHVTVITIPDFKNKTNINPLRPYTPIGLLHNIDNYLKTVTSPFVKLHVKNPQFEEIQLDFKVKFFDNLDNSFYSNLLNDEIEKFLCPWAYSDGGNFIRR